MILVLDNYDSFTYNLVQLLQSILHSTGEEVVVQRNDETTIAEIEDLAPRKILLSPGPGRPENAGICVEVIKSLGATIPILGVCLGHQAIGIAFGGTIVQAPTLMHGRTSLILHDGRSIFASVKNPFSAMRYHSLVLSPDNLPRELEVIARTEDGVIMGIRHTSLAIAGVQFHPESILTEEGERIVRNWLQVQ
jgi:anthranilate synthase component 2